MDLAAYRDDGVTVDWTARVKPERIVEQLPVRAAIHSLLGRTLLMGGRGPYFNSEVVSALSSDDWGAISRQAHNIASYLQGVSKTESTPEDIQRTFSQVFHIWSPDNAIGAESRTALSKALEVLGLGTALSSEEVFPQLKAPKEPSAFRS